MWSIFTRSIQRYAVHSWAQIHCRLCTQSWCWSCHRWDDLAPHLLLATSDQGAHQIEANVRFIDKTFRGSVVYEFMWKCTTNPRAFSIFPRYPLAMDCLLRWHFDLSDLFDYYRRNWLFESWPYRLELRFKDCSLLLYDYLQIYGMDSKLQSVTFNPCFCG